MKMRKFKSACIFSVTLITLTFGFFVKALQDEYSVPDTDPRSLTTATEKMKRGEITRDDKRNLASRGRFLTNEKQQHIQSIFLLDNRQAIVRGNLNSDGSVSVTVEVGGAIYDAVYDYPNKEIRFDGRGSTLGDRDKLLLTALTYRMEREDWDLSPESISLEKALSYRFVSYLSSMPKGFKMNQFAVPIREPKLLKPEEINYQNISPESERSGPLIKNEILQPLTLCPSGSLNSTLKLGCGLESLALFHDACSIHPWESFTKSVGCNLNNACLGRCGEDCGDNSGRGTYALDCARHDDCCRHHGGGEECRSAEAPYCGDEFIEAADDWAYLADTCNGCASTPPPCNSPVESTETWVMEESGSTTIGAVSDYNLTKSESRPEKSIFLEEWAIVEFADTIKVVNSSSNDYAKFVENSRKGFEKHSISGQVLLVEAAKEVHSTQHINNETKGRFEIHLSGGNKLEIEGIWLRAEIDEEGLIDRLEFLTHGDKLSSDQVMPAMAGELHNQWSLTEGHRRILFARANLSPDNIFRVEQGLVIVPQCCHELQCPPLPLYKCL